MAVPSFDYRCRSCGKLLCKGFLVEGEMEVKCRGCHALTHITADRTNELLCLIPHCPNRIAFTPDAAAQST